MPQEEIEFSSELTELEHHVMLDIDDLDPVKRAEIIYQLWWRWGGDFAIYIISPTIPRISPPIIIEPENVPGPHTHQEHVYPIHDFGDILKTSRGDEMLTAGLSNCKLHLTIEKMFHLLIERLKTGGISAETEVQIAFSGHQVAQRKGFEVTINLDENVVVTNFDPGAWGERYLEMVRNMSKKGYGYPTKAPRTRYRDVTPQTSKPPR